MLFGLSFSSRMFALQMLTDLNTYLNKAIPDTRLTIKKYLDVKFEYLVSYQFFFFFKKLKLSFIEL